MYTLSRVIIAVPILIVIFALLLRFSYPDRYQSSRNYLPQKYSQAVPLRKYTQEKEALPKPQESTSASFDIVKSRTCTFQNGEVDAQVYISKGRVSANVLRDGETDRFIVSDDCVYTWKTGEYVGKRICGIGQYLNLFQTYSSFLSKDMLSSILPTLGGMSSIGGDTIS